ncbi:MAG: hypothetical protein IKY82_08190 [Alistipes sp.]|nr:hypothetical protein [Alistipes sp.]
MNHQKILLLIAVEEELGTEAVAELRSRCDVALTGVGKLNAFEATFAALQQGPYDVVINLGTCGSMKHPAGTVLRPGIVAQGDIYIDSVFATAPEHLNTGCDTTSISSADNFIGADTPASQLKLLEPYDCVDMESYAIVRAVKFHSQLTATPAPKIEMIKVVSDMADETLDDWSARLESLRHTLLQALDDVLKIY